MNRTLFSFEMKKCSRILLIFAAVLTMYTTMIVWMFDPALGESLNMLMESMPEIFALVGMDAPGTTLLDFINNYLFSFLYKVFPIVFFAFLVNRVLIRYLDKGAMAYLLSTANSRLRISFTQAMVIVCQQLLLFAYVAVLTLAVCRIQFPGELDIPGFLLEIAGIFGLMLLLSGICFLCGCLFEDSALAVGVGLNVAFVLAEMLSQVGDRLSWLRFCTPLTLFDTAAIAGGNLGGITLLYLGGLSLYAAGIAVFCKKDLSL